MNMSRTSRLSLRTLCCLLLLGSLPCHGKKALAIDEQLRNLSVEELMRVQYYSNGFNLVRIVSSTSEHSASGTLATKNGQAYCALAGNGNAWLDGQPDSRQNEAQTEVSNPNPLHLSR
jgi:hypothetical protein